MNSKRRRKNLGTRVHTRWEHPQSLSLLDAGHRMMIKQKETLQVASQSHFFLYLALVWPTSHNDTEGLGCIQRAAVIRCKGMQRGEMVWTSSSYTKGQGQAKSVQEMLHLVAVSFDPLLNFCFQINLKYYLIFNLVFLAAWDYWENFILC